MHYDDKVYSREDFERVMRETYGELIEFVTSPPFRSVVEEMDRLPPEARPTFVKVVLLNPGALHRRGVIVPEGVLIQRSAFGDRRPTLFVVKKFLPNMYRESWENVNITFYEQYDDADVSYDGALAWRRPLPVEVQSQLMTRGVGLDDFHELEEPQAEGSKA